jgi:hypothetical protein
MQSVFISSEESSSYIDSNETISDSNNSSTSYVPAADNFSEEYSNQLGGAIDIAKETQEVTKDIAKGAQEVTENIVKSIPPEVKEKAQEVTENIAKGTQKVIGNITQGAQELYKTLVPEKTREEIEKTTNQIIDKTTEIVSDTAEQVGQVVTVAAKEVEKAVTKTNQTAGSLENLSKNDLINMYTDVLNKLNKKERLEQLGGSFNPKKTKKYYEKYLKYKLKYLEMKYE